MLNCRSFSRRPVLATGLALLVLGSTVHRGVPVNADTPLRPAIPVVHAPAAPAITPLQVEVGGHKATVIFTTSEPTTVSVELKLVTATPPSPPPAGPLGNVRAPLAGSVATTGNTPPLVFSTQHQVPLTNLKSNTTYDVFVAATTRSGQRLSGSARFMTLKERVKITLDYIDIQDDGDGFFTGDGEPLWKLDLTYPGSNTVTTCFPLDCHYGSYGEGRVTPRTASGEPLYWLLAEEVSPLPNEFTIQVRAYEDDVRWSGACVGFCDDTKPAHITWRRPQGVEDFAATVQVRGDDGQGFKSVLTFSINIYHDAFDMSQF